MLHVAEMQNFGTKNTPNFYWITVVQMAMSLIIVKTLLSPDFS